MYTNMGTLNKIGIPFSEELVYFQNLQIDLRRRKMDHKMISVVIS